MALLDYWLSTAGDIYLEIDQSGPSPHCVLTRLRPAEGVPTGNPGASRFGANGRPDLQGWRLPASQIRAADGVQVAGPAEVARLSPSRRDLLCQAFLLMLELDFPFIFRGNVPEGSALTRLMARLLGLRSSSYVLTTMTSQRDIIGRRENLASPSATRFSERLFNGGIFQLDVPELFRPTATMLSNFCAFLRPFAYDFSHSYGYPDGFQPHADFFLVMNVPRSGYRIPSEVTSRVRFIDLDDAEADANVTPGYRTVQAGPGYVLALMSFRPEYEDFFLNVVKPTIESIAGRENCCIRLDEPMDEWRTEVRRAFERADAILADVSHDVDSGLSTNVIWELAELYNEVTRGGNAGLRRDSVLCFARGLANVQSRTDDDFVYSADVNVPWFPLTQRSMNVEDLLGLKIRRYDQNDPQSIDRLRQWIAASLTPWLQGIPAPVSDDEIYARAMTIAELAFREQPDVWINQILRYRELSKVDFSQVSAVDCAKIWLLAIAERNFHACDVLLDKTGRIPDGLEEPFGWLLASVSAADAYRMNKYWSFAKAVIERSPTFRSHLLNLLESRQTHAKHWSFNNFRENAWFCLGRTKPREIALERLRNIALMEEDPEIKRTADDMLLEFLPEQERKGEQVQRLMQILLRPKEN